MSNSPLTKLEREALEVILSDPDVDPHLYAQISVTRVRERQESRVGVFVELEVPDSFASKSIDSMTLSRLCGEAEGLKLGFGAVLFIKNGKLEMLEFFTYDDPWPAEIANYRLWLMPLSQVR